MKKSFQENIFAIFVENFQELKKIDIGDFLFLGYKEWFKSGSFSHLYPDFFWPIIWTSAAWPA
jgi:hypothetical protein